jgi:hypothetical protein
MYGGLATIRNGHMQMQWSRAQMYLAFNAIGLPLIFNPTLNTSAKFVLSIVGMTITSCLPYTILRGQMWMKFFNNKLAELERLDSEGERSPRIKVFSDPQFEAITTRRISSRKLFIPLCILLTGIWIEEAIRYGYLAYASFR